MVRVWPSASMESIFAAVTARPFIPMVRSRQALQASASTGLPLWKVTPSRICRTQVVGSGCSQESASRGLSSRFSSTHVSVSVMPARQEVQPS